MNLRGTVILSRSVAEAKNLMPRQTCSEILRRFAPQNDTPQNHSDAVLVMSLSGSPLLLVEQLKPFGELCHVLNAPALLPSLPSLTVLSALIISAS